MALSFTHPFPDLADTYDWFRARLTAIACLRRRGYDDVDRVTTYTDFRDFVRACGAAPPSETAMAIWLPDRKLLVQFCTTPKALGIAHVRELSRLSCERGVKNLIIVSRQGITSSAKSQISELFGKDTRVRMFLRSELLVDIFAHVNMPRIRVLSSEEWRDVSKRRVPATTAQNLPKILRTDPVSRLLDLRPGQVIEAVYPSINCGEHTEYHVVA